MRIENKLQCDSLIENRKNEEKLIFDRIKEVFNEKGELAIVANSEVQFIVIITDEGYILYAPEIESPLHVFEKLDDLMVEIFVNLPFLSGVEVRKIQQFKIVFQGEII